MRGEPLARALATAGGLADHLPAPGTTVGSLLAAAGFYALARGLPGHVEVVATAILAVLLPLSVWACGVEAARRGITDPGPVVLDEVAGQWLALVVQGALSSRPSWTLGALLLSFLLFRAFDVVKPWPISRLERLPGGWGIVADDLAAGLAAGLVAVAAGRFLS